MALGLTSQSNIAYKNLLGKSLTQIANGIFNEGIGISFNVTSNNIWLASLPSSATQAVSMGYAVQVVGSMSEILGQNKFAYSLNWPSTPPSGTDPLTSTSFVYNSGSLLGINSGNIINNAISDSYGTSYVINLSGTTGTIYVGDPRNWVYQYNSGIYFQESNSNLTSNGGVPATASVYVYIGPTLQSQPNTPFTAASSSQVSVGGLQAGTTFNNVTINNILLNMLYPLNQPAITTFSMSGVSNAYEVGNVINSGSYNINWVISNTASLTSNSVSIIGYNNTVYSSISNTSPYSYTLATNLSYTTPTMATWYMSVLENNGIRISSSFSIGWYYNLYYGSSSLTNLTNPSVLQNSTLTTNVSGRYILPGITGSYKFIAVPDSYTLSSITWNGLPLVLADSNDGYTYSVNNLSYSYLTGYSNAYSIAVNYKIYRSKYMLAATMSNVIIS